MRRPTALLMALALVVGCKPATKASSSDAGHADSGPILVDAGPPDAGATCTPPTTGAVGAACQQDSDCHGAGAICLTDLPGGFCVVPDCQANACPAGSLCTAFADGTSNCVPQCFGRDSCCGRTGYFCDTDDTCWNDAYSVINPDAGPVGATCAGDADCESGYCVPETLGGRQTGNAGGYCTHDCVANHTASCPSGTQCRDYLCRKSCHTNADCREAPYSCQDGACVTDPSLVASGSACTPATEATDCGPGSCLTSADTVQSFPGGFCSLVDTCEPGPNQGCGAGHNCVKFASATGPAAFCAPACVRDSDCRTADGYTCNARTASCLRGKADPAKVSIGRTCTGDADCNLSGETHGLCLFSLADGTVLPDGYCVAPDCTPLDHSAGTVDTCGMTATCRDLGPSPFLYCVKSCQRSTECRPGYACVDGACWAPN
jgi:hypothetical protein